MVTQLVLMGLLSLCSIPSSQECNTELMVNLDFPGTDIAHLYSPDVMHCQRLCTEHPSCLFFTFIRSDWTRDDRHFHCYLKSTSSGQPNVQSPLLGVTSGFSLKPCSSLPKPCLSEVYQNLDFLGADYRTLFTSDYKECQRACTEDYGCQFFTFVLKDFKPERIRYKCHLKFSFSVPRTPIVERKAGLVSGFSHKTQMSQNFNTACQNQLFPSTDIPGHDNKVLPAASPEHCRALCSAYPRCNFFSYVSDNFDCYLKTNVDDMMMKAKDGITSGVPSRFCQLDNNWIKVSHEGVDFRGSDIRHVLTDDAQMCQRNCTEDPNCQFYTYINENFSNSDYWLRCQLKRVITMPAPTKITKLNNVLSGFTLKNCPTDV